jgi:hypothetical protein
MEKVKNHVRLIKFGIVLKDYFRHLTAQFRALDSDYECIVFITAGHCLLRVSRSIQDPTTVSY